MQYMDGLKQTQIDLESAEELIVNDYWSTDGATTPSDDSVGRTRCSSASTFLYTNG